MATDIQVEIEGLAELESNMERAVREIPGGLRGAMGKATLLVERRAKQYSPVDTGRLRSSITSEVRSMGSEVVGVVGSNVKYAPYVEKPGNVRGVGRRPYLRPAFTEQKDAILEILGKWMKDVVGTITTGR